MKNSIFASLLLVLSLTLVQGQEYPYRVSTDAPYGLPNPSAPKQVLDYAEMIGESSCKSVVRLSQTEWADTVNIIWEFKYILNGHAVQDVTHKEDGIHSGSIRQFDPDSILWYVHYYSSSQPYNSISSWQGNRVGDKIVLYKDQKAPNGMDGYMRLTFYDITNNGFNWTGDWTDKSEEFVYPTWKIFCTKEE